MKTCSQIALLVGILSLLAACGGDAEHEPESEQLSSVSDSIEPQHNHSDSRSLYRVHDSFDMHLVESILISEGLAEIDVDSIVTRLTNFSHLSEFQKNRNRERYYTFIQSKIDEIVLDVLTEDIAIGSINGVLSEYDFESNSFTHDSSFLEGSFTMSREGSEYWDMGYRYVDTHAGRGKLSFAELAPDTRIEYAYDRNPFAPVILEFETAEHGEDFLKAFGRTPKRFNFWKIKEVTTENRWIEIIYEYQCHVFVGSDNERNTIYHISTSVDVVNIAPCERFASSGQDGISLGGLTHNIHRIQAIPDEMKEQDIWVEE